MALNFSDYKCEYCGATCTQVLFASFLCGKKECENKARDARGGPGGHMNRKAAGKSIQPEDIISENMIVGSSGEEPEKR